MIRRRLTGLRLPLEHDAAALRAAVRAAFGVADEALLAVEVFRRAYDARKKSEIALVYTIDATLADAVTAGEEVPDVGYRFVARAANRPARRPVVIGTGPCGIFAALVLAQMGFAPLILERGKVVRERTKDTWGLWRRGVLNP
ncbi:MAG: hypothetical protein B7Z80_21000, partial [Rhodospirillales bacterium 20-64-7]